MTAYWKLLQERVLEHRYRYYCLDHPVLNDFEYDYIENLYEAECKKANVKSILIDHGVGFDSEHTEFKLAKQRVNSNVDFYSLWVAQMTPVWKRLGFPRYLRK